jgi:hypothetical protein
MDNGNGYAFEKPQCHKSSFTVVESIILVRNRRSFEDLRRVTEVELVSPEISSSFALIPFKAHRRSVYAYRYPVKMRLSCAEGIVLENRIPENAIQIAAILDDLRDTRFETIKHTMGFRPGSDDSG